MLFRSKKNETGPLSYTIHKNKFNMDERHKCETGNHQNLTEKTGSNLFNLGHSNFFLDMSLDARETKANINYWDCIKTRNFSPVKEIINKTKRQPME